MTLSSKIKQEINDIARPIDRVIFWVIHNLHNKVISKIKLKGYVDNIKKVDTISHARKGVFAVFVYYEPDGNISGSAQRLVKAMAGKHINIIIVVNHKLSDNQTLFFTQHCHTIIIRGNQGFDFGCFKDSIKYIKDYDLSPARLIMINDSIFFSSVGLDDFIEQLIGEEDVISAYENWAEGYHFQSFALSLSSNVIQSKEFVDFWQNYTPYNSRVFAINEGEKRFSRAVLKSAKNTRVIYSTARLYDELCSEKTIKSPHFYINLPLPWRNDLLAILNSIKIGNDNPPDRQDNGDHLVKNELHNSASEAQIAMKLAATAICQIISGTSSIHSGAYFFPKYLKSPLYKKDLVYRGRFHFWEIAAWTRELLPDHEHLELMSILRKRGDYSWLSAIEKYKYWHGLK